MKRSPLARVRARKRKDVIDMRKMTGKDVFGIQAMEQVLATSRGAPPEARRAAIQRQAEMAVIRRELAAIRARRKKKAK